MKKLVVKIGGTITENTTILSKALDAIHQYTTNNAIQYAIVHGGGKKVSEYCKQNNITAQFDSQGRRITNNEEMNAIDKILAGEINIALVRLYRSLSINAVGLSGVDGHMIIGRCIRNGKQETLTGMVESCNIEIISCLIAHSAVPVINSVAADAYGAPLNINADETAQKIAEAWHADYLLFLSDVPGIIFNDIVSPTLTHDSIEQGITSGKIHSGMIIKARNAIAALSHGVSRVIIGQYTIPDDIASLLENKKGTMIHI